VRAWGQNPDEKQKQTKKKKKNKKPMDSLVRNRHWEASQHGPLVHSSETALIFELPGQTSMHAQFEPAHEQTLPPVQSVSLEHIAMLDWLEHKQQTNSMKIGTSSTAQIILGSALPDSHSWRLEHLANLIGIAIALSQITHYAERRSHWFSLSLEIRGRLHVDPADKWFE
jgi:hypothetical protein